ncbi:hypothetical protein A0H81_06845 [Grifola frondosa]|uniref:Uncharacterized protein n=1 Tax=Grifola frondosa TaxID=5627 RepID=A0A1C7M7G0_GRIFR|nr:hypothetical protein A0H81_06845 [Grifola frondosa]
MAPSKMSSKSRKRKQRTYDYPISVQSSEGPIQSDSSLFIQAHEADLVRGPQAVAAARSLEIEYSGGIRRPVRVGDGLIKWSGGEVKNEVVDPDEEADDQDIPDTDDGIWLDRYDARLLLDALPTIPAPHTSVSDPGSPSGWSDLPSDAEDMFFLSPSETEDYQRTKRRRAIAEDREARLRALRAIQMRKRRKYGVGAMKKYPSDEQRELMRRTATHILASPNPAQLELRILANHGADPRFAFLRGRWTRAWRLTKGHIRLEKEQEIEKEREKEKPGTALGGLAGYGESDEESGEEAEPKVRMGVPEGSGSAVPAAVAAAGKVDGERKQHHLKKH